MTTTPPSLLAYPIDSLVSVHGVTLRQWNAVSRGGKSLTLLVGAIAPRGVTTAEELRQIVEDLTVGRRGRRVLPLSYCCRPEQLLDVSFATQGTLFS